MVCQNFGKSLFFPTIDFLPKVGTLSHVRILQNIGKFFPLSFSLPKLYHMPKFLQATKVVATCVRIEPSPVHCGHS
jgi:hypothetical protein